MARTKLYLAYVMLWSAVASAQPHHKLNLLKHLGEHLLLGAATEVAVSQVAGGPQKYWAGITATAVVAAFKEGTDAHDGKDTKREAAWHAFSITAGSGVMAAARH